MKINQLIITLATMAVASACSQDATEQAPSPTAPAEPITEFTTASDATKQANNALQAYLPFEDTRDYENAQRGFIATLKTGRVMAADGGVSYDTTQFDFLEGDAPRIR